MTCHQGRASGADVDAAISKAGVTSPDQASPMLSFLNVHYYPAAATLYAGRARGGYQYAGHVYDVRFRHVEPFDTCIECHDPHSTRVRFDACGGCHQGVKDGQGARTIRMMSSFGRDYDGDGDVTEGISGELDGSRTRLLAAMQAYGRERAAPLCYSPAAYPYVFADTNGDGQCGADEAIPTNAYKAWTPRLMRAAYNYQMATKDPGAFAHNAKYILELLYDSVQDLNAGLTAKIDLSKAARTDVGHFNGASEAARHWDADEAVTADCSRCHSGEEGYRFFVQYGVGTKVPETANGLECATCHTSFGAEFAVLDVAKTPFPSGVTLMQPGRDNLCGTCHAGRAAKNTVDAQIAANKLGFVNVHYLPAAATKAGASAGVGYQYAGKTYAGPLAHQGGTQCTSCHDPVASQHTFRITDAWKVACRGCHADANGDPEAIRLVHKADYDGDGNAAESLRAEVDGLAARLLTAMRVAAPGLCYSAEAYPYFFSAAPTGPTTCAAADAVAVNAFKAWTPDLMRAAFDYQLSRKEPGAWAHNFDYVVQLLYDSIEAMGGAVAGLQRP
jgi:predicted CXXCH cytochrome family protein